MLKNQPKIVVLKRRTLDWKNITIEDFLAQPDEKFYNQSFKEKFVKKIEMWDSTFAIKYFEYRYCIKEIAQCNLEEIRNIIICESMDEVKKIKGDFWLLFSDDDDWFRQDISEEISKIPLGNYHWPFWRVTPEKIIKHENFDIEIDNICVRCYTNNHVISSHTLKRFEYTNMLERHLWLNRTIDTKLLAIPLSAVIWHGANITNLWNQNEVVKFNEGFNYLPPEWMNVYFAKLKKMYLRLNNFYL
jgi:hypothetical protein